jgi:hypothetical protein
MTRNFVGAVALAVVGSQYAGIWAGKIRALASRINASPLGWIALGATLISIIGYVIQTILDYVSLPAVVGAFAFFGIFGVFAIIALVIGVVAILTGWRRGDHTFRLGLVAVAWVVLVQTNLSLRD